MVGWVEVLRYINIALSALACTLLLVTLIRRWDWLTKRVRRIGLWLCALLVYLSYSSAEALALEVEPGPRIPMLTIILCGMVVQIIWHFNAGMSNLQNRASKRHN